ncbi:MAG: hypothetical protein ACJ748_01615, partial [Flavisolibacter sp.]
SSSKGRKSYYHYYHCISSCGVRYKSELAEDAFKNELSKWKPHPAVGHLYKVYLEDLQIQTHKIRQQELILIQQEMNRLKERQNKARELLLSDGLEPDDYKTIKRECEQSISRLEAKLPELTSTVTDIAPMMDNALVLLDELDIAYEKFTTIKKRELIGSIFPEKLQFDGVGYRTTRINEAVQLIYSLGEAFREIEMGQIKSISDLSHQVNPLVHFSNQFLVDLRKLSQLQASIYNAA